MTSELDERIADRRPDLETSLRGLYGEETADALTANLIDRARRHHAARPDGLAALDRRRSARPGWHLANERIGYMAYVDRFGSDLDGVRARVPYLCELGVDTLHLLSLLEPRSGDSDGGYAIRDYLRPDPRLGTNADLDRLTTTLHANDISLCLDFVLNHTSDQHEWAVAAANGSAYHQRLYRTFPDRVEPDRWEATLPEVFPELAPGNFTWHDGMQQWVWTTFRDFQWDLDWSNPDVMTEIVDIALALANRGVDILRLDAIAFTWKRLGTNCQNQPEAHLIGQALRAVVGIAAPATVLLAEAIVPPDDLVAYLGRHTLERRECDLAYHNQLMVQGWSMLASGRADLARVALARLPATPAMASWFTYVRCHDDIGWAIDDTDAAAVGLDGAAHREFLARFYRGDFWQSFGRGTPFGTNEATGDERTSGMATALAGVTAAIDEGDDEALERGLARIRLLYAIAFGYGGTPIIYSGDELGQGDDTTWRTDPARSADTRWAHRPPFDDDLAARRHDADSTAGRMWDAIRNLVEARRRTPQLDDAGASVELVDVGRSDVFAWRRHHPRFGRLLGLAHVGSEPITLDPWLIPDSLVDQLHPTDGHIHVLAPLQVRWLVDPSDTGAHPKPIDPDRSG